VNRLDSVFKTGRKAFIPYLTAGYPTVAESVAILHHAVAHGADVLELGYPFSDPTADGPVLQVSAQVALQRGFTRPDYFAILRQFRQQDQRTPVVVFSYYNPIFHLGAERFVTTAAEAGADAMLVVDLPFEEQRELRPHLDRAGMHLIQLVAPTTPEARAREILAQATGFVYQIARLGVTGVRTELSTELAGQAARLRQWTKLPIALGFGVSTPDQAATVARFTDGVIVGSAIVKTITDHLPDYQQALVTQVQGLADAIHATT
jgi:tryptophan synthase alpha chain